MLNGTFRQQPRLLLNAGNVDSRFTLLGLTGVTTPHVWGLGRMLCRVGRVAYKGRKGEAERRGDPCPAQGTTSEECSGWFCGLPH